VSSKNLAAFVYPHSCRVLQVPTIFDDVSNSQHSALEHPDSVCKLRRSPQCAWRNCDFGLWRGV